MVRDSLQKMLNVDKDLQVLLLRYILSILCIYYTTWHTAFTVNAILVIAQFYHDMNLLYLESVEENT